MKVVQVEIAQNTRNHDDSDAAILPGSPNDALFQNSTSWESWSPNPSKGYEMKSVKLKVHYVGFSWLNAPSLPFPSVYDDLRFSQQVPVAYVQVTYIHTSWLFSC